MSPSKNPLDILQSMVNGILIETGRALRGSDKEGGRTLANTSTRLRSTIPSAIENFHQALDDLESDIVRAKAVLLRDLEELRSKRYAEENPPVEIVEPVIEPPVDVEIHTEDNKVGETQLSPQPFIKEEKQDIDEASSITQDPPKETIPKIPGDPKGVQGPSPPSSNETDSKPDPVGLDINNNTAPANATPLPAAGLQDSSIDSLFEAPDSINNNATSDLNFDGMDLFDDSAIQDASQTQNEFDLSAFGSNPQDFNMADMEGTTGTQNTTNNAEDDLFGMIDVSGGGNMMDIDTNIQPAEESAFEDLFFMDAGDDGAINGGGEMQHDFDDAFFGLNNE